MECRSCGAYYKGKVCPKCGYGGKTGSSKAAAKYRKARKPERFRTEEDNKLYAQWDAEKAGERKRDPDAAKKFLAVLAVAVVIVVVVALFQTGAIFSNDMHEVVGSYFDSVQSKDYDSYLKCFPKIMRRSIEDDRDEAGLSKQEYMQELYDGLAEGLDLGGDYTISYVLGRETALAKGDYDLSGFKEAYGSEPVLDEVCEVVVDVTFIGQGNSKEARLYLYMGKSWGYWRIYGLEEDGGMLTDSGEMTE